MTCYAELLAVTAVDGSIKEICKEIKHLKFQKCITQVHYKGTSSTPFHVSNLFHSHPRFPSSTPSPKLNVSPDYLSCGQVAFCYLELGPDGPQPSHLRHRIPSRHPDLNLCYILQANRSCLQYPYREVSPQIADSWSRALQPRQRINLQALSFASPPQD